MELRTLTESGDNIKLEAAREKSRESSRKSRRKQAAEQAAAAADAAESGAETEPAAKPAAAAADGVLEENPPQEERVVVDLSECHEAKIKEQDIQLKEKSETIEFLQLDGVRVAEQLREVQSSSERDNAALTKQLDVRQEKMFTSVGAALCEVSTRPPVLCARSTKGSVGQRG